MNCYECDCEIEGSYYTREIEVARGRSGSSMTFGGSSNNRGRSRSGMSFNTGRTYYKVEHVPICVSCNSLSSRLKSVFFKILKICLWIAAIFLCILGISIYQEISNKRSNTVQKNFVPTESYTTYLGLSNKDNEVPTIIPDRNEGSTDITLPQKDDSKPIVLEESRD